MKRALIILGSPRGRQSSSFNVARHFISGLNKAGVKTEEIQLKDQKIAHCNGCFNCWLKTPGKCIHKDDMQALLPKLEKADLIVYAFPLYVYNMPGMVKDFIDRQLPLKKPDIIDINGISAHPLRNPDITARKIFLIAVAGFPEQIHFTGLKTVFEHSFRGEQNKYIGSICIGAAEPLSRPELQNAFEDLFKIIDQAGFEIGSNGKLSIATEQRLLKITAKSKQEIEECRSIGNNYWKSFNPSEQKTIKILQGDKPLTIHSRGSGSVFAGMARQYNANEIPDLEGVIQFKFEDESYFLVIKNKQCQAYQGEVPDALLTIKTHKKIWFAISQGKLSGEKAFFDKKLTIDGELGLLIKFNKLFSANTNQANNLKQDDNESNPDSSTRGPIKLPGMAWLSVIFMPWILRWVWTGINDNIFPHMATMSIALIISIYHISTNKITLFELGSAIYLSCYCILRYLNIGIIINYVNMFDYLFLGGLWLGSLIKHFSITGEYAKYHYPEPVWNTKSFRETNMILTCIWGLYFLLCVIISLLFKDQIISKSISLALTYGLLGLLLVFTLIFQRKYPEIVLAREQSKSILLEEI